MSVPAQSRGLPSPCGRLDDDSPHACPCKREAGVSWYSPPSLLRQGLSYLYSLGNDGDTSPQLARQATLAYGTAQTTHT